MSVSLRVRSPVTVRKTRRDRSVRLEESACWEDSVCSGDKLINEHVTRVSWWLVAVMAITALVLVGIIMQHAFDTQTTGPWSNLNATSWIQPTPRALASLVGIAIVLDLYTSYVMALKKGHLDAYIGQFVLTSFLRVSLWILFLYGLSYGGSIGAFWALVTLALVLGWGFMTGHAHAPMHAWISALQLVFVIFLLVWLGLCAAGSGATIIWPTP